MHESIIATNSMGTCIPPPQISSDGLSVTLSAPLRFTHFAGVVSSTSHFGGSVSVAAAAALLEALVAPCCRLLLPRSVMTPTLSCAGVHAVLALAFTAKSRSKPCSRSSRRRPMHACAGRSQLMTLREGRGCRAGIVTGAVQRSPPGLARLVQKCCV